MSRYYQFGFLSWFYQNYRKYSLLLSCGYYNHYPSTTVYLLYLLMYPEWHRKDCLLILLPRNYLDESVSNKKIFLYVQLFTILALWFSFTRTIFLQVTFSFANTWRILVVLFLLIFFVSKIFIWFSQTSLNFWDCIINLDWKALWVLLLLISLCI